MTDKVPDKIYVDKQEGKIITLNRVCSSDICYIRKDALIEWAKARLSDVRGINYDEDNYPAGEAHAIADVIDHLNSL